LLKNENELRDYLLRKNTAGENELSIIDTAGFAPEDIRFRETLARFGDVDIYLAISAATDYPALNKVLSLNADIDITGCLMTKLDEAAQLGGAISALVRAKIPLAYVSAGQAVPNDLEPANADQLVAQAVAMGALASTPANSLAIESAFASISRG
ncbi:MAG: hypothetical protein AAF387_22160, partial [Pseudomonadota bacterium]